VGVGFFKVSLEFSLEVFLKSLLRNPATFAGMTIRWRAKQTIALRRIDDRGRIDGHIGLRRQWR
jgi:hypothetical protein